MLILTRKTGEEIQIGLTINIRVLTLSRRRVKLGVSGPRERFGHARGAMPGRSTRHAGTVPTSSLGG